MGIGYWAKMGFITEWSVPGDWPLGLWSAKRVLGKRLKFGNGHGLCYLKCDGRITVWRAQTGAPLLSKYCVKYRATDTWVLQWNLKRILAMSFCRLAWKEKAVKAVEKLTDQSVPKCREDRRVGEVKAWMVYVLTDSSGVSYRILMLLLVCEGMSSLQSRWLVGGAWTGLNKHECLPKNKWEFGLLFHTKIMEPTLMGGSPWLLC